MVNPAGAKTAGGRATAAGVEADPVAKRLAGGGQEHAPSVVEWLDGQHRRSAMRRRAGLCVLSGWLLLVVAAMTASGVAHYISRDVRAILADELLSGPEPPAALVVVPVALMIFTLLLVLSGVAAWAYQRVPGFSKTVSALDWSGASDAVTRLVSAGCTYPEAFRLAAAVTRSDGSRRWLIGAAERVERGGAEVSDDRPQSPGDAAVLELLVGSSDSPPQQRWRVASDHFYVVAQRRLTLLLQTTPMIATVLSGIIVWLAISTTLGWMWRAVGEMMREMSGGMQFW